MSQVENKDTRYFVDIERASLKVIRCGYEQKENLDSGRQNDPEVPRLFITKGQYKKLVNRCGSALGTHIEI